MPRSPGVRHAIALAAYLKLDYRLFLRDPMVVFFAFVFPPAMYVVFGLMFGGNTYGEAGTAYFDEYTSSFIGIILLNVALFNIGPGLVIHKEFGFFRRLLATPLSMGVVLWATLLRSFVLFLLGIIEIILVGWLMFDRMPPVHPSQTALAMAVCAFALFSFGFMLGSFFKTSAAAFGASILVFQVMLMLSGAAFPLEQYPAFVQTIAMLVPMTYVVDVLRLAWFGSLFTPDALSGVCACIGIGIGCVLVSLRTFRWSAR